MKKRFHRRGPRGTYEQFHTADDPWQPLPGQRTVFADLLLGSGRVRVDSVCPIYSGSPGTTAEMIDLIGSRSDVVYLRYLDVYCEEDPDPDEYPGQHSFAIAGDSVRDDPALAKRFLRRGPDLRMHEFHTATDAWQPIPGQDIAFTDVVHGAGWVTVAAVVPLYVGSLAHTEMARLLSNRPSVVHMRHIDVYCERKLLPGEPGYQD